MLKSFDVKSEQQEQAEICRVVFYDLKPAERTQILNGIYPHYIKPLLEELSITPEQLREYAIAQ